MSTEVSTRRLCAAMLLLALGFTSLAQTGCTTPIRRLGIIDELAIAFRDQVWAQRAYNLRFANCNREFETHFRNGFCAGFNDVCNGGDGFEPALPPESYRGFEFQCAEGANCVAAWYDGYPEGVAAARAEDAGSYHKLHVSRLVDRAIAQDESANLLPSDIPVTKPPAPKPRVATSQSTKTKAPPIPKNSYAARTFGSRFKPVGDSTGQSPKVSNNNRIAAVKPPTKTISDRPIKLAAPSGPSLIPAARTAKLPQVNGAPTFNTSTQTKQSLPPIIQGNSSTQVRSIVPPPIIQGNYLTQANSAATPPIVRGRRIDPSANVSANEIPLPMAVRSTFNSRTAAWPVNRK